MNVSFWVLAYVLKVHEVSGLEVSSFDMVSNVE